ncbi:PLP-dependent aminotransferase family protein [Streptomyces alkaliterrae]|uniref:Aminotransferase class I/II-fold pyridoxal phosphate-dependent enzyme n=1 Tax=Streptomyces alkaliterrae TaxID=2213162 RepID=A0A5P0YN39_9ACTN|nr:PLP-dependent aminotransferase family protein [Streptomyces alkaliterrae]MBB1260197.1 PLP-dependent aminotransferase family protein [Streptomyces alkaliterrae]MQS01716.1 aminotransferase class I/II-fold pyridoxal phosphate-dependent enzyme [Streptomyces alkaliterrae]
MGSDLHLELDRPGGVRRSLTDSLREAVRGGRLAPGTRLPSSRSLAVDLGVARNTVAEAYADLVAEGWLVARQGSGTRVAERAAPAPAPRPVAAVRGNPLRRPVTPGHDLLSGRPDVSAFPRRAWLASTRRALASAPAAAFGLGDALGRPELRGALAGYLARARGVRAAPEQVVVCAGFGEVMDLLGRLLAGSGTLAVEGYGLWLHRDALGAAGCDVRPLTVDGGGACVEELGGREDVGAVLLTPAHQYPLGVALRADRRAAVLDWARTTGGLVLEDDYDGEFRYDRQRVGSLQGLDPDRVVYLGTASKSLAPGLRLAWMVVPERLVGLVRDLRVTSRSSTLDQLVLADFLDTGGYDRHVRAMRLRYRRRRDRLTSMLAEHAPHLEVRGINAGLHAVLALPDGTERSVVRAAARGGLALEGLERFRHPGHPAGVGGVPADAVVVGYAAPPDHGYAAALAALLDALPGVPEGRK